MEYLRLNTRMNRMAGLSVLMLAVFRALVLAVPRWLARRYRYGLMADDLAAAPDYLLKDIGLARGEIDNLRYHGHPRSDY